MYAVYKQAHPPTGLEFAMYCNFFNNSERNLVVAGTSQLYVYRLNRDAEVGQVGIAERLPAAMPPDSPAITARSDPWFVVLRAGSLALTNRARTLLHLSFSLVLLNPKLIISVCLCVWYVVRMRQ